jgi:hypothetical protein
MATNAEETRTTDYMAGRLDELEKENAMLRRELQALRAERDVARGAAQSAMAERVAAHELTGRLAAEERATQAALAEQSSNFSYVNIMLLLTFLVTLVVALGIFIWVPGRVANDLQSRTVIAPAAGPAPAAPAYPVR